MTTDIIQDLTSILEEMPPRCQEVIERAIQEIEERDAEIAKLKTDLTKKNVVIEEQDQRFVSFFKFCVEALNDATEALEIVCPGKETRTFINETKKAVETATPNGRPYAVVGRVRQIIGMMKETPPLLIETEKRYTYNTRTRTENRALALVDHIKCTDKTSIKSSDARTVLETIEGRPLDRKIVHRALNAAQSLLRASKDTIGGISRLIMPSAPLSPRRDIFGGGGGGDMVSRRLREGAPPGG